MPILVPLQFWLMLSLFTCSGDGTASGPAPRGALVRGRASPNENCAPLSEDCTPKKIQARCHWSAVRGLRPPKYWSSPLNSWARTVLSPVLRWRLFFCLFGLHSRIRGNKVFEKKVTLHWRQTFKFLSLCVALVGTIDADVTRGESRWSGPLLKPD